MKGILFQPDMIRQIIAKKKRATRRIINSNWWRCLDPEDSEDIVRAVAMCPYGKVGGVLAVREAWRTISAFDNLKPRELPHDAQIHYAVDGLHPLQFGRYRHARFMPLRFSRLKLPLSSVRVEHLLGITEADAIAEGFESRAAFLARWDEINGPGNPHVWVLGWT